MESGHSEREYLALDFLQDRLRNGREARSAFRDRPRR